ncbi:MAG: F0F1 ATP synthase subunit B [Lentisphaerae bacterium ADurb.BinA184]|nr:MAG: F0F1 ATP synthase subunit B [Lentisphaerae bacterium ADurb.BinA184]
MDMFSLSTIIIIQVITFLVLVLLLRRLLYSAYAAELKRLRELNAENQNKAEKLARELEATEHEHRRRMETAEAEIRDLRNRLQADAKQQREDVLRKAREESDRIVGQAMGMKDRLREELEGQLQERSVGMACQLIKDVLSGDSMRGFHEGLVQDVTADLARVAEDKLRGLDPARPVLVRTPYRLTEAQVGEVASALSRQSGRRLQLSQQTDPEVIAGLEISAGSLLIDGSLAGQLRRIAARRIDK